MIANLECEIQLISEYFKIKIKEYQSIVVKEYAWYYFDL